MNTAFTLFLSLYVMDANAAPTNDNTRNTYPLVSRNPHGNVTFIKFEDIPWANETSLQKRGTPGGCEICTDINWGGTCGYKVQPLSTIFKAPDAGREICIVLTSPWYHTISSFVPDQGAYVQGFENNACGFETDDPAGPPSVTISYPGYPDLRSVGNQGNWNDMIGSFFVWQNPH
ncbi:hypothetical protein GGI43DRAFT_419074 [Trichoderma evansii]